MTTSPLTSMAANLGERLYGTVYTAELTRPSKNTNAKSEEVDTFKVRSPNIHDEVPSLRERASDLQSMNVRNKALTYASGIALIPFATVELAVRSVFRALAIIVINLATLGLINLPIKQLKSFQKSLYGAKDVVVTAKTLKELVRAVKATNVNSTSKADHAAKIGAALDKVLAISISPIEEAVANLPQAMAAREQGGLVASAAMNLALRYVSTGKSLQGAYENDAGAQSAGAGAGATSPTGPRTAGSVARKPTTTINPQALLMLALGGTPMAQRVLSSVTQTPAGHEGRVRSDSDMSGVE